MLLIGNGRVITRDQENPYLEDGAVVISGEKIKEVGSLTEMKAKYPEAEFVDAKGGVIMPGLINAHTHIYSGLARGLSIAGNNPTNFLEVLDGTWWAIDRHLTLDGTKACAYATVLDCIRNGVTTIFDHHASFGEISGSLFAIKDVVKEFGRVDVLVNGLKAQLKASNYTLKDYLSAYGIEDETSLRDQYKSSCESTVKVFLIADAIAADKKISVTDEDVKAYFNGEDTAQYEKQYSKAYINRIVLNNLVIQEIEKNVTVK